MRIILMSATMHYGLYREYFNMYGQYGDLECLSVGVRRFPLSISYAEDLADLAPKAARTLVELTSRDPGVFVSPQVHTNQYILVEQIASHIGLLGKGVLVFVSGMPDIIKLSEVFEENNKKRSSFDRYKVFVIHSEIPLEEVAQ